MDTKAGPAWIRWSIIVGAVLFVFALLVSAVFEPKIRILHTLQALIYFALIALTRRNSAWGYGAGCIISSFWNYINLFVTTFIKAGVEQLLDLLQTGQLERPDLALSLIAGGGHCLLIIACLAGFLRTSPQARDGVSSLEVVCLPWPISQQIITTGHQYIGLLKRVFGL